MMTQHRELKLLFLLSASDSPPHVPADELSTDIVIQVISNMTQTIRQHFPNLTVYPALGNHDYWPQVTLRRRMGSFSDSFSWSGDSFNE